MPIYEFECRSCGRKTSALVMDRARAGEVRCRRCGAADLERLYSRFATPKSDDARLDALADSAPPDAEGDDPKSVARWMQRMGREMGEDMGDDFEQAMEEEISGAAGAPGDDGGGDDL
jgi:putative FmdB family regulatory protein